MRIGIDIDETLTETEKSFNRVIKKYDINFGKTYKEKWNKTDFKYLSNYLPEILGKAEFKFESIEVVNELSKLGHEIYIITARGNNYSKRIKDVTGNMLKDKNLKFNEIYYDKYKKSDIAKKLNLDLMIDDSKYVYENMKKENIECILFGDKIKTWTEVLEYIKRKG